MNQKKEWINIVWSTISKTNKLMVIIIYGLINLTFENFFSISMFYLLTNYYIYQFNKKTN